MKKINFFSIAITVTAFIAACGSGTTPTDENHGASDIQANGNTETVVKESDNSKGIGKFQNVELAHPLDKKMIEKGSATFDVKCNSCHKLTDEKLVGPGWKGVTDRRKPEWIMNFATNTDEMLDKDANAKAMIEVCMVRMPNQNLSEVEARQILEFMRKNDGKN